MTKVRSYFCSGPDCKLCKTEKERLAEALNAKFQTKKNILPQEKKR